MAEEIINIQIVEEVENITISIQEPSKTSDLINDGADGVHPFITSSQTINDASSTVKGILKLTNDLGGTADLPTVPALANKVDKVTGKGLSTNDYTTAEQTKLAGIQTGATANDTDANLKNRANHTGTQLAATISDFATAVGLLITNKVDKVVGYSLTKNDLTDLLKTAYDNAVSSLTSLLATGQRLITSSEITKLSNTSGTNTGDQNLTGLVPYTGASTDVDLNTKNLKVNNVFEGFTSVAASATLITLTVNSTPSYLVTGSGGQTIKLPNATTLQNGAIYDFNNNQSSGAISVNNNSNTLVKSIPSGGYLVLTLIDNSTAAGSWDAHFQAPSNVSWSTNTFDVPASITSATWNGVSIADNRIASATTWNAKEDSSNKVTTFTGNETSTTKFPVVKAILDYFTAANIKTILGITTLSGSNTGDETSSTIATALGYTPANDTTVVHLDGTETITGLKTFQGATQTGSSANGILNFLQTWNTTGTLTAIKLNITDTASNASSLLMDLQVGGTSKFYVKKSGEVVAQSVVYARQYTNLSGASTLSADFDSGTATIYNTSGIFNVFGIAKTFSPTSGTATFTGLNFATTINQTGGANGITRGLYINPTLTNAIDFRAIEVTAGKIVFSATNTASGTTGAQTINKISGKVNAAAATTSLVVTNSLVTTSSIVMCQLGTNDATCVIKSVVEANGSFTIYYTAPTAETVIKFKVIN